MLEKVSWFENVVASKRFLESLCIPEPARLVTRQILDIGMPRYQALLNGIERFTLVIAYW